MLGADATSCTDACTAEGMTCEENGLAAANHLIDSDEKLQAVMTDLGSSCTTFNGAYTSSSDVPNLIISSDICYTTGVDRDVSTFDCTQSGATGKSRLCWCGEFQGTRPSAFTTAGL